MLILGAIAMLSNTAMAPALFVLGPSGFTLYPVAMSSGAVKRCSIGELVGRGMTALLMQYYTDGLVVPGMIALLLQNYLLIACCL